MTRFRAGKFTYIKHKIHLPIFLRPGAFRKILHKTAVFVSKTHKGRPLRGRFYCILEKCSVY
ncbi:hypothetical protein H9X81_05890 [Hydrogenoanaerobacterium saccharovorans]|uniref:Uncharacterized protein n=1 Tax=Hydrogenoanaerobacterium saccharovorans TaxID=474960 RepID=A0ABS2GMM3_9FIRM|nr:hypothetical protein [Hydrogenoanaerobacterium saccharovorans]MBM6923221.1 hypothetical protein [Hydrogenoanaerobacterium saccharovorans]